MKREGITFPLTAEEERAQEIASQQAMAAQFSAWAKASPSTS